MIFLLFASVNLTKIHISFNVSDSVCFQLEMEIETDSVVSKENVETAVKFGVTTSDTMDARKGYFFTEKKMIRIYSRFIWIQQ